MHGNRVLITGASGFVASIIRPFLQAQPVTLLSRRKPQMLPNEQWLRAPELVDTVGWETVELEQDYCLVLHFAEVVKGLVPQEDLVRIVESHLRFLKRMAHLAGKVYYPLTAYAYDDVVSRDNEIYRDIKAAVFKNLRAEGGNIFFPVIHPIYNAGSGLSAIIDVVAKLPLLNIFCAFKETMPILDVNDLASHLFDTSDPAQLFDVYSAETTVATIFQNPNRKDLMSVSLILKRLLSLARQYPQIALLIGGRSIQHHRFTNGS